MKRGAREQRSGIRDRPRAQSVRRKAQGVLPLRLFYRFACSIAALVLPLRSFKAFETFNCDGRHTRSGIHFARRARTSSLMRFTWPRPRPFTSQPSSK
jgi:hypothetical protein